MAVKSSGQLSFNSDIVGEFGGSAPHALSEYKRGGSFVPNASANNNIPTTNSNIKFSNFYGSTDVIPMTYEIIGGGGEGAGGWAGGLGSAGGSSSFSASGISTVTASGGAGGAGNGSGYGYFDGFWVVGEAGQASYYGSGGAGGLNSDSGNQTPGFPAPSSSYGAGGGGGGSASFAARNGGDGGKASTRQTGTINISPGTSVSVTIGSGGSGIYGGGDGAKGYARFTVSGQTFTFTSSGSFTVPS